MSSENGNPLDVVPGEVVAGGTRSNILAASVIRYLETLTLAGGDHDGKKFAVLDWERDFIEGAFGVSGDASLSVARGNGKSALCAGVACAVVDPAGPLNGRRREVVICASRFAQARIIYEDVIEFLRGFDYDLENRSTWRKMDSQNTAWIEHRASGARVRCIGSDSASAHGLRPFLVLIDEPSEWPAARRDRMVSALRTGLGKTPGSRLFALGTRPVGDHFFARMLSDPGASGYSQCHAGGSARRSFQRRNLATCESESYNHLPSFALENRGTRDRGET